MLRDGDAVKTLAAGLSVLHSDNDGKLTFVRKYDVDAGDKNTGTQMTPVPYSGTIPIRRSMRVDFIRGGLPAALCLWDDWSPKH
jgi:hypothetical protein